MELEDKLRRADVIDVSALSGNRVQFGARVRLADEDTDEEVTYQIVGADEADIRQGLLSVTSPVARAIIGRVAGDSVEVNTPGGIKCYEIMKVSYK
jgi:transcription elongation factor GreA